MADEPRIDGILAEFAFLTGVGPHPAGKRVPRHEGPPFEPHGCPGPPLLGGPPPRGHHHMLIRGEVNLPIKTALLHTRCKLGRHQRETVETGQPQHAFQSPRPTDPDFKEHRRAAAARLEEHLDPAIGTHRIINPAAVEPDLDRRPRHIGSREQRLRHLQRDPVGSGAHGIRKHVFATVGEQAGLQPRRLHDRLARHLLPTGRQRQRRGVLKAGRRP